MLVHAVVIVFRALMFPLRWHLALAPEHFALCDKAKSRN